jgi:adhesin transport system outer membrane protein
MRQISASKVSNKAGVFAPACLRATAVGVLLTVSGGSVFAADLKNVLSDLLKTHPRLEAARKDVSSAENKVSETVRRAWTPNLEASAEDGKQLYESQSNDDRLHYQRTNIKATQQLLDFGKSSRQIAETEAVSRQSQALASAAEAGLLLEALSAHWSHVRATKLLEFARQSEQSVRRQTDMETSIVELGKGYESNVLQAKVQLSTTESRRLRAEGALDISSARIKALFGEAAAKVDYKSLAVVKAGMLPATLEAAQELALKNNQQIQVGLNRSQAIQERIGSTQAKEFFPRLNLVAERSTRYNTDGVENVRTFNDSKYYLQFQYNLNAGMAGGRAVEAVKNDHEASVSREIETRQLVLEQVNIAWRNVKVAQENRSTLANLVRIAAKYYEMALAERQMGRRTLLEVLNAELSLINSLSDLVSTETDIAISQLTLLQAMGKLDLNSVELKSTESVIPKI